MSTHTTLGPCTFTNLAKVKTTAQPHLSFGHCFRLSSHTRVGTIPAKLIVQSQTIVVNYLRTLCILALGHAGTAAFETIVTFSEDAFFRLKIDDPKQFRMQR